MINCTNTKFKHGISLETEKTSVVTQRRNLSLIYNITKRFENIFSNSFSWVTKYCNKCVLSLTHMLILNICLTMSMHGLYTTTQHPDKTLEPLNWTRVCPSCRDEHSHEGSHVLYYVSCNISKYTTFKPHTCPSFCIFIPSNGSHLM